MKICFFLCFRGPGGPGDLTDRRGMKKYLQGLILKNSGPRRGQFRPILKILCVGKICIFDDLA